MTEEKAVENRVRRAAARQGLTLVKSRLRDTNAVGFGSYHLVDRSGAVVFADMTVMASFNQGGKTIAEVETYLSKPWQPKQGGGAR